MTTIWSWRELVAGSDDPERAISPCWQDVCEEEAKAGASRLMHELVDATRGQGDRHQLLTQYLPLPYRDVEHSLLSLVYFWTHVLEGGAARERSGSRGSEPERWDDTEASPYAALGAGEYDPSETEDLFWSSSSDDLTGEEVDADNDPAWSAMDDLDEGERTTDVLAFIHAQRNQCGRQDEMWQVPGSGEHEEEGVDASTKRERHRWGAVRKRFAAHYRSIESGRALPFGKVQDVLIQALWKSLPSPNSAWIKDGRVQPLVGKQTDVDLLEGQALSDLLLDAYLAAYHPEETSDVRQAFDTWFCRYSWRALVCDNAIREAQSLLGKEVSNEEDARELPPNAPVEDLRLSDEAKRLIEERAELAGFARREFGTLPLPFSDAWFVESDLVMGLARTLSRQSDNSNDHADRARVLCRLYQLLRERAELDLGLSRLEHELVIVLVCCPTFWADAPRKAPSLQAATYVSGSAASLASVRDRALKKIRSFCEQSELANTWGSDTLDALRAFVGHPARSSLWFRFGASAPDDAPDRLRWWIDHDGEVMGPMARSVATGIWDTLRHAKSDLDTWIARADTQNLMPGFGNAMDAIDLAADRLKLAQSPATSLRSLKPLGPDRVAAMLVRGELLAGRSTSGIGAVRSWDARSNGNGTNLVLWLMDQCRDHTLRRLASARFRLDSNTSVSTSDIAGFADGPRASDFLDTRDREWAAPTIYRFEQPAPRASKGNEVAAAALGGVVALYGPADMRPWKLRQEYTSSNAPFFRLDGVVKRVDNDRWVIAGVRPVHDGVFRTHAQRGLRVPPLTDGIRDYFEWSEHSDHKSQREEHLADPPWMFALSRISEAERKRDRLVSTDPWILLVSPRVLGACFVWTTP